MLVRADGRPCSSSPAVNARRAVAERHRENLRQIAQLLQCHNPIPWVVGSVQVWEVSVSAGNSLLPMPAQGHHRYRIGNQASKQQPERLAGSEIGFAASIRAPNDSRECSCLQRDEPGRSEVCGRVGALPAHILPLRGHH